MSQHRTVVSLEQQIVTTLHHLDETLLQQVLEFTHSLLQRQKRATLTEKQQILLEISTWDEESLHAIEQVQQEIQSWPIPQR